MNATILPFKRPKPRTLAEIFIMRRRESMTLKLIAETVAQREVDEAARSYEQERV